MKPAETFLFGVIALAALGAGAFFFFSGSDQEPTNVDAPETRQRSVETRPHEPAVVKEQEKREKAPEGVERKAVDMTPKDLPQGFTGTVVDASGTPVADATVYLVHGFQPQDLFALLGQARGGRVHRKVESEARSDQTGVFKLPCAVYSGMQPFEIVVEHKLLVTNDKKSDLRVTEGSYKDVGRIVMKNGNVIEGAITMAGAGSPIPGAVVRLRQGANAFFARMPGSENGMEAKTESDGRYRFQNVESGSVELEAAAKGFAMEVRTGILVQEGQTPNQQNFELQKGYEIAGVVTDAEGKPIRQARVVADAISTKAHVQVSSFTDQSGWFELLGVLEGQYVVAAEADGFVRNDKKPVGAGDRNVQIALEKQGGVRVIVTGKNGQLLSRYTLELKSYFEGQPDNFGRVPDKYPVEVRGAKKGEYVLEGINPGNYVLQVEAPQHAKKFSDKFTVAGGVDQPLVQVQLGQGGAISGQIVNADGRPLAGVSVSTMPNNLDENPFTQWIIGLVPKKITETSVTTGADGKFKMILLLPDKYQLKIVHPEHYRVNKKDIEVNEGQEHDLGVLKLSAGIRVRGVVYVNGKPEPAVEVTISGTGGGPLFSEKALSDEKGRFEIGVPLPPGKYEATASRTQLGNPIMKIADYQKSRKEITLLEGQPVQEIMINIDDSMANQPGGLFAPQGTTGSGK